VKPQLSRRSLIFELVLAVAMLALSISISVSLLASPRRRRVPGSPFAWLFVHSLSLAGRRIWPLPVLVINVTSGLAVALLGFNPIVLGPAVLVALYTAASERGREVSLPAALLTIAGAMVALRVSGSGTQLPTYVADAIVLFVAWFLGDSAHSRRAYVAALEQRTAELERAR